MKDQLITLSTRQNVYRLIDKFMGENPQKKFRINLVEQGKKRTISANNQQHLWYGQIAKAKGDVTPLDVKNWCKASIGLPIINNSAVHGDKMGFLLDKLDYYNHSYENQMRLIQCLEVTSLFNTPESKEYMENMIFYWNENGVPIKFKDK
jgi:hypothetical protein